MSSLARASGVIGVGKLGEQEERGFVIKALSEGRAKTVSAARKAYAAAQGKAPAPLSDRDRKLARLMDAWDRGGPEARRRFLEERGEAVRQVLRDIDGEDAT